MNFRVCNLPRHLNPRPNAIDHHLACTPGMVAKRLSDSIKLTNEARVIIRATAPYNIIHTSVGFFLVSGYPFASIENHPIDPIITLTTALRDAFGTGRNVTETTSLFDAYLGRHVRVRVSYQ